MNIRLRETRLLFCGNPERSSKKISHDIVDWQDLIAEMRRARGGCVRFFGTRFFIKTCIRLNDEAAAPGSDDSLERAV
jgi:hypothetical protein